FTIPIIGDSRRQTGLVKLDLTALELHAGDVATIRLRAEDRAGHATLGEPARVFAAEQSVDPRLRRTAAELSSAGAAQQTDVDQSHRTIDRTSLDLLGALAWCTDRHRADSLTALATQQDDPARSSAITRMAQALHARLLLADWQNLARSLPLVPRDSAP